MSFIVEKMLVEQKSEKLAPAETLVCAGTATKDIVDFLPFKSEQAVIS